ncbi:hypothetical protein TPHA_0E00930 [Tetrapisispora phaffii CBS 4417]|uniref:Guanine-nucleotide exchange factor YEL1 n=1 Tax=Tetrapisispora phaffii (strain ATCC 24235 / CBS 4417 / NBRC 1672 / NRRL Y-8282 / UCD 70-5) TaxID=1071381 RepID=G8BTF9_TETPH|nr:hypothetical protein TPHA_0E00930 [Tetrapisispora phaffii CBS 4417]CCE63187.1 hypothetical protein TPHA_0E00930 [Tetrapisispora phaffii CBS 4417]
MSRFDRGRNLVEVEQRNASLTSIPNSLINSKRLKNRSESFFFTTSRESIPPNRSVTTSAIEPTKTGITDDKDYQIALEIFNFRYKKIDYKEYANFLGTSKNNKILKYYINLLEPFPHSLLALLEKLSERIYFIAEAQNIDRILEEVSIQYINFFTNVDSQPNVIGLWHFNYKIVHITLFSLLLMNSDLHNEENVKHQQKNKVSQYSVDTFLDNTIYAIKKEYFPDAPNREIDSLNLPNQDELVSELTSYFELNKNKPLSLFSKDGNKGEGGGGKNKNSKKKLEKEYTSISGGNNSLTVKGSSTNNRGTRSRRSSIYSLSHTRSPSLHSVNSAFSSKTTATSNSYGNQTSDFDIANTSADWKFHNNIPLSNLFHPEPFDSEFMHENFTYWFMDGIIMIASNSNHNKKLNRIYNNNSNNSNSNTDEASMRRLTSSSSLNSLATSTDKKNRDKSKFKSPQKLLFKFLRKSKKPTIFDEAITPSAFLNEKSTWSRAKVQISEGRIFIFKLHHMLNISTTNLLKIGDIEEFKKLSSSYVVHNLFNVLAELVQENVVIGQSPNSSNIVEARGNFMISIPNPLGKCKLLVLEFQTDTVEEAQLYVETINFWAARLTPVPSAQFELVSNEEYGWSSLLLSNPQKINKVPSISTWAPLLTSDLLCTEDDSIIDESPLQERIDQLTKFTTELEQLLDEHNNNKPKIIQIWSNTPSFDKIMDNWNHRYLFLNKQFEKQSIYLKALNKAKEIIPN